MHFCYLLTLMSGRSNPFSSLKRAGGGGVATGGGGRSRKKSCRQEEADAEKDAADAAKTQKSNADKAAHAEKTKAAGAGDVHRAPCSNRKQVHDPHEGALRPCCTLRLSGHAGSGHVV